MFKTYDLFDHRNINDLIPEIVYYYLFQGLSLTAIEYKLFKTNGQVLPDAFQFDKDVREDGYREMSINWNDCG